MIITENQREYLGDCFERLYDLTVRSSLPFPYGLPGWKGFHDMSSLCEKLLKLNRLSPEKLKPRISAADAWCHLLEHVELHEDDGEENMLYIIRVIPAVVQRMDAEKPFSH